MLMLTEISQTEKTPNDFTHMWNPKKQNKWTHRYREQTGSCQREDRSGKTEKISEKD